LPSLGAVADEQRPAAVRACRDPFVARPWAVVHSIDAGLPFGGRATFIGATAAREDGLRSVLMSLEGMVLFDGSWSEAGGVVVHRALPPLDRPGFAPGLLSDVRLMLVAPSGPPRRVGTLPSGRRACRWRGPSGRTVDVVAQADGGWQIRAYDPSGNRVRTVRATGPARHGFASRMTLQATDGADYSLDLELLEVEADVDVDVDPDVGDEPDGAPSTPR
jgi:hypothetical protein